MCEIHKLHPDDFEVEHFQGQKEAEELIFTWTNLYLACKNCNGMKPRTTPEGGYLAPCNETDNVETEIKYVLGQRFFDRPSFTKSNQNPSVKVTNTIDLLTRLHHGHNPNTRRKTASLRELINRRAKKLVLAITKHKEALNHQDHAAAKQNEAQIRRYLSRRAPFTMLMRCIGSRYDYHYLFD